MLILKREKISVKINILVKIINKGITKVVQKKIFFQLSNAVMPIILF